MWSRSELKERAKSVLREIYWSAFGISLVILLAGGHNRWSSNGGHSNNNNSGGNFFVDGHQLIFDHKIAAFSFSVFITIMLLRIFIGYCLEVGGRRYFIKSAEHLSSKGCFGFTFNGENYLGVVKTMLLTKILIFLWTLLLIIPGIIKAYAYSMVPYILAENPNIGAERAIELSNEMTRGHKFDMFVLDLSFIGWYILGAICLGIGTLFVLPYDNATHAELYLVLRENALRSNMCTYEELMQLQPVGDDIF